VAPVIGLKIMSDETARPPKQASSGLRKIRAWVVTTRKLSSRWSGSIIRIFIVLLAILLLVVVAVDWNLWIGSAVLQTTDDDFGEIACGLLRL
jgi:hypothetical protein